MKKFVNSLSTFRIFAAFAMIPLLMFQMYWSAFILFVLGAVSDWLDGYLARKYQVTSKIGGVLDHIGDKFLIVNTLVLLSIMMPIWFVIIPVIVMIARELYISGLREFLGTQKIEMPVPKSKFSIGKIKTALQMVSISAFLCMFALGTIVGPFTTSRILLFIIYALPMIGVGFLWLALVASLWSATQYTIDFAKKYKAIK